MRGAFEDQGGLFSYISPEARIPASHPLRKIRELVREVLGERNRSLGRLYASEGRPSIPPEQLLSALLLQVFYGIRSERQLMEQLDYNFLYRWFVGLSPDDPVWAPTTFTKNRDRLQKGEVFTKFMSKLLNHPQRWPVCPHTPIAPPSVAPQRSCSRPRAKPLAGASRPVRTRPMTRPIMWPIFAPGTSHRM
jgi:transposase